MGPDPADLALLNYLHGEPEVVRAAEVLCNAAARFTKAQRTLTNATAALTNALSDAGVQKGDVPQIACAFTYLHHRACHELHRSATGEKGGHHSER